MTNTFSLEGEGVGLARDGARRCTRLGPIRDREVQPIKPTCPNYSLWYKVEHEERPCTPLESAVLITQ
jgi:hypothetical protein